MRFATFCVGWTFHLYWKCWKLRKLVHSTRTSRGNRCASVMVYLWTRTIVLHISSFFGVAFVFIRNIYIYIYIYIYVKRYNGGKQLPIFTILMDKVPIWFAIALGHIQSSGECYPCTHTSVHNIIRLSTHQRRHWTLHSIVSFGLSMSIDWYVELCACVRMCINERTFTTHIQMSNNPA